MSGIDSLVEKRAKKKIGYVIHGGQIRGQVYCRKMLMKIKRWHFLSITLAEMKNTNVSKWAFTLLKAVLEYNFAKEK